MSTDNQEEKIIVVPALPPDLHLPFQVPLRDYVKVHHSIYEYWMPRLSGNAFKAFSWAMRRIIGWVDEDTGQPRKDEIAISLDDFMEHTGITNRRVMVAAIQECLQIGALIEGNKRGAHGAKYYAMRRDPRSYAYAIPVKEKRSGGKSATSTPQGRGRPVADMPPTEMADMPLVEVTDVPLDAMADMPPDNSRQGNQEEALRNPKETSLKKDLNKSERNIGASANASRPDGYMKSEEEKTEETDPTPLQREGNTIRSEATTPRSEEMPPRRPVDSEATEQLEKLKAELAQIREWQQEPLEKIEAIALRNKARRLERKIEELEGQHGVS